MLSKGFTGIFTYNFEDYNDPLDPRYRYNILKDLLKGEKDIRWISATALPSIPLNFSILEGIDYYILPNVSEIESLFKYLNTQDKGVIILDNFDHLLSNNTHNARFFFQWIFESMKKGLKIVFFAHGRPSDQVDSEGRRKVRAPWHYLMVYHGKNYSIKLNHIWLLRTPGYSQEKMEKKTFVRMIFTPTIIKDISGLETRVVEITDKIREIPNTKNADIYTKLIQCVWLTHSKRYEYNPLVKQLKLEHKIVKLEPIGTYKKTKSMTHAPKKTVNVIKYVIKQKSFSFIDKKKYNFRISTFGSTEKLCHTFIDDLQIKGDLKNKIIEKSGDVLWLLPFFAIFTYHFKDIHGIDPPEESLDNSLRYPQIKNWLGGESIRYFKVFDAKKVPPLAKRLAASIHPIDTLFNLPVYKVDELLDAGKNCTIILHDLSPLNYLTLKLEGIRDIYSISNSPITFKEDWSSELIAEIDEDMEKMSKKHVFQGRLVDLRPVDDLYYSDTTDLTFDQATIYIESLRILIKIGIAGSEMIWNVIIPQEK